MSNKNILIGNGINIAFSKNDDYKNYEIIKRLSNSIINNSFKDVFENTISPNQLLAVLDMLKDKLNSMLILYNENKLRFVAKLIADELIKSGDELRTLLDIISRYKDKAQDVFSIGIEDYFFITKIVFNEVGDEKTPLNALNQGLQYLFLDSIFNDGKIQHLYKEMKPYSKELEKYDNIFTINYDTNIDKLTDKTVYHLHGSFDVLDNAYIHGTIVEFMNQNKYKSSTVIKGKEYLYCNAIMSFSGTRKIQIINEYSKQNRQLDDLMNRNIYNKLKESCDEKAIKLTQLIEAKLQNPKLRNEEYPIDEFKSITGELHIIGMSPNNDSHIFDMINQNNNINKIVYYSASSNDSNKIKKIINKEKDIEIKNVFEYWKSLHI